MNILIVENNIWYDIALIGIGILATLVGGMGMKLLETKFNKIGKLALYYRVINIYRDLNYRVTIRVQIKNPSRDVKFLRDICLYETYNCMKIRALPAEKMTTCNNGEVKEVKKLANNGSYSIASESRSIVEYELKYIFPRNKVNIDNDFILTFADDNEKLQIIKLNMAVTDEWIVADIQRAED